MLPMYVNPFKRIGTYKLTAGVIGWTQSNRSSRTLDEVWRFEGWREMGKYINEMSHFKSLYHLQRKLQKPDIIFNTHFNSFCYLVLLWTTSPVYSWSLGPSYRIPQFEAPPPIGPPLSETACRHTAPISQGMPALDVLQGNKKKNSTMMENIL